MRPLRLTLQAFGPYPAREVVDFRPALEAGLFGIYGATGSGKSTIFSAMTFALFGEAARHEQHASTLRSDHAVPGLLTSVELVFELGSRRYLVKRQPEQIRPAKRGSGETSERAKAWLTDVTGLDLDGLGDDLPGRVLAEGKVTAVDAKIRELLGYDAAQFRQIVLLPQGRFEAFLTADTGERIAILRELFDVSLYRKLTERLKEDARLAEERITKARDRCETLLQDKGLASIEALKEAIADAAAHRVEQDMVAADARAALAAAMERHRLASELAAAFVRHAQAQHEVTANEARAGEFASLEQSIAGARAALQMRDVDTAFAEARTAVTTTTRAHDEAQAAHAARNAEHEQAISALADLEAQAHEIDALKQHLRELAGHRDAIARCAELAISVTAAEVIARQTAEAANTAQTRVATLMARRDSLRVDLDAARDAELRRARLASQIAETTSALAAATAFTRTRERVSNARSARDKAVAVEAAAAKSKAAAEDQLASAEVAVRVAHAALLAATLADGEPCPVCGSDEHPHPAVLSVAADPNDLTGKRDACERATAEWHRASARRESASTELDRLEIELAASTAPERPADEVSVHLAALETEADALGPPTDVGALAAAHAEIEHMLADAQHRAAELSETLRAAEASATRARWDLDSRLSGVPEDLRPAGAIEAAIAAVEQDAAARRSKLSGAREHERLASELAIRARSNADNAAERAEEAITRLTSATSAFEARLTELGLSPQTYATHKRSIACIADWQAAQNAWRDACAEARARLAAAAEAIADRADPDVAGAKVEADAAETAATAAADAATRAATRVEDLERLAKSLADRIAEADRLEEATGPLRDLARACSGFTGPRVDLETFAIWMMFDRVLEAANRRLAPMTRGRYALVRDVDGRGTARRGLGIQVDDAFTGRQRATATLSGGETFIAALALALGLSEVVESARGSVRLDTIFIDEGFGSLDSHDDAGTLDQVLQVLQELVGRNRAVGVISHVPLVQEQIPNGFYVRGGPAGSRIEPRLTG